MNEAKLKLLVQRIANMPKVKNLIRHMQNKHDGVKIDELEIVLTGRKGGETIWQLEGEAKQGR